MELLTWCMQAISTQSARLVCSAMSLLLG